MTDGTRVLKTVAVPLGIALVFLFFIPKTCEKMIGSKKLRATGASTAAAPTDTALHISSDTPAAPGAAPAAASSSYPAGLDAQRVQYEIEINPRFSDPMGYRLPKPGAVIVALDTAPAEALVRAGWFQQAVGGGYMPTTEASLHIPQLTEEPQAWRVPLGTRKFMRVTSVEDLGDGKARVAFTWQWEPNEAGRAVRSNFDLHQGTADFVGGGEHSWDVGALTVDSEWK